MTWNVGMMVQPEYTKRRNLNRGYMKLEVWQESMLLLELVERTLLEAQSKDLKMQSQILNAVQSVSSNIAEGYCRKTVNECLYFINVALGSMGELMTRVAGLRLMNRITAESFESFDSFHYRVENKLLALKKALQSKRFTGTWEVAIPDRAKFPATESH